MVTFLLVLFAGLLGFSWLEILIFLILFQLIAD